MNKIIALFIVGLCVVTENKASTSSSDIHQPCNEDKDCLKIPCSVSGEKAICHLSSHHPRIFECHCHEDHEDGHHECHDPQDCTAECGQNATCDDGHCHGNCTHT